MNFMALKPILINGGKFLAKYWPAILDAIEKIPVLVIKIKDGIDTISFTISKIQKHKILIFGESGSGKTALRYFLQHGHPYLQLKENKKIEILEPNPTIGDPEEIKEKNRIRISKDDGVMITYDVGGEELYHDVWKQLIEKVRPKGIVYMIDGTRPIDHIDKTIDILFNKIIEFLPLSTAKTSVSSIYVFLNFYDKWSNNSEVDRMKLKSVQELLDKKRVNITSNIEHIEIKADKSQLSLHGKPWTETNKAVKHFVADMHE